MHCMRNANRWSPTKYVHRRGRLRASRDPAHLAVGSRLVADLIAGCYDRHLPGHARGRLLDLGCGRVPLYGAYHPHVREVVTLDRAGATDEDSCVDIDHDLNRLLPFDDGAFDTVILSDVLEHIRLPRQLCGEIARVMAGSGRLLGNTPFMYPIHEAPHDYFRYTEFGLRQMLEAAGLEVVLLSPVGGSLEVGCDLMAKHLAQMAAPGRICAGWLQGAAGWLGATGAGRAMVRRSGARYTLGYFFVAVKPDRRFV